MGATADPYPARTPGCGWALGVCSPGSTVSVGPARRGGRPVPPHVRGVDLGPWPGPVGDGGRGGGAPAALRASSLVEWVQCVCAVGTASVVGVRRPSRADGASPHACTTPSPRMRTACPVCLFTALACMIRDERRRRAPHSPRSAERAVGSSRNTTGELLLSLAAQLERTARVNQEGEDEKERDIVHAFCLSYTPSPRSYGRHRGRLCMHRGHELHICAQMCGARGVGLVNLAKTGRSRVHLLPPLSHIVTPRAQGGGPPTAGFPSCRPF